MQKEAIKRLFLRLHKGGICTDKEFDMVYPASIRHLSYHYWSSFELSVKTAVLACQHNKNAKILDVGSGSGKFCLIGSLVTDGRFYGVENRDYLVKTAKELAALAPVNRPNFILGDMAKIDWNDYETIFMFNPLSEYKRTYRMDEASATDLSAYDWYFSTMLEKLKQMKRGTQFIAVCEADFFPPDSYRKTHSSVVDGLPFGVWQKE